MLRAIFRRRFKDNTSGIVIDNQLYSLDFHHEGIQKELTAGGFGESGFEVRELVGIEAIDGMEPQQCDPPEADRDRKRKILQPPPTREQELLRHIASIAHTGGSLGLTISNALTFVRQLTIRYQRRDATIKELENDLQKATRAADREYGRALGGSLSEEEKVEIENAPDGASIKIDDPSNAPQQQVVSEKAPAGVEHSDDSLAAAWNRFVSAGSDTEIPESIPYGISDAVSLLTRHLQDVRGNVPHADLLFAMQELTRRYSDVRFRGVSDEALAQLTTAVVLMIEEAGIPLGKPAVSVKEQKSTLQPDFRGSS